MPISLSPPFAALTAEDVRRWEALAAAAPPTPTLSEAFPNSDDEHTEPSSQSRGNVSKGADPDGGLTLEVKPLVMEERLMGPPCRAEHVRQHDSVQDDCAQVFQPRFDPPEDDDSDTDESQHTFDTAEADWPGPRSGLLYETFQLHQRTTRQQLEHHGFRRAAPQTFFFSLDTSVSNAVSAGITVPETSYRHIL
jgi:hypothetical protein